MSYSVIYLENHKCKVCEAIDRNVIEPVAVFVPQGKENLKSELEKLNSEQLEEKLKEHYQNIKGKTQTKIPATNSYTYQTCIFHCEKENEIWMENFNDGYEEFAKKREKATQEEKPFYEEFKIQWNENLVNKFWRRIRAYRFAVEIVNILEPNQYEHTTNITLLKEKISQNYISQQDKKSYYLSLISNIENHHDINIDFIDYYLSQLKNININGKLILNNFQFPILDFNDKKTGFWFTNEDKSFFYQVIFKECIFLDKADFIGFEFNNKIRLLGCKFYNNFDLSESEFNKEAKFLVYGYYDNKENKVEIQNLIINSIYNYSETIRFYGIKVKNLLKITNTSLKNFDFNNLDLTEAEAIVFRNVSFDNCILNNIHWGDVSEERINIIEAYLSEKELETLKEEKLIELRDIYRQLKLALDKQEDHITANEFYALEMKAYQKEIKENKRNFLQKIEDIFLIGIYGIFSNFGQSFLIPTLSLLWLAAIFSIIVNYYDNIDKNALFPIGFSINYRSINYPFHPFLYYILIIPLIPVLLYISDKFTGEIKVFHRELIFSFFIIIAIPVSVYLITYFTGFENFELSWMNILLYLIDSINPLNILKQNLNDTFFKIIYTIPELKILWFFHSLLILLFLFFIGIAIKRKVKR